MKIAINGMGRIGRLFLRAAINSGLDVVCCNEPVGDGEGLALGIEFDSVQRRYQKPVRFAEGCILVGEHPIRFSQVAKIEELPWQDLGIDLVVECSGRLRRRSDCLPHLEHFTKKVLVSNPVVGAANLVFGVNHHSIEFAEHEVITAASCTTNCLSPIVRVLHDKIGIARGAVTTLHDPTNTQVVVDRPHKDARRARSALVNLVPTSTNSATAVTEIIPELKGRLDSIAVRVPVLNASIVDCAFSMERDTDVEEVNGVLAQAAAGAMRDILGYETRPLVSSDYANDPRSGIVDALSTRCIDRRLVKLLAWYDNEWGYANRMVDLARCVQSSL